MSTPGIELRWGKGFEDPYKREQARPILNHAREYTYDALASLELPLTQAKRVIIRDVESHRYLGESIGVTTSYVYFRPSWSRMTELKAITIAGIMVHEVTHGVRAERFEKSTGLELAATEGLAYVAQRRSIDHIYNLFGDERARPGIVSQVNDMPRTKRETIRREFLDVAEGAESWSDQLDREWCIKSVPNYGIGKSEIVGIDAVSRHVQAGRKIAELIALPAEEVLGINQF